MQLLFIRHGQSEWNAARRWQGRANSPLTSLGRQQAFAAAKNVGTVDAIVASPLERAQETAIIISDQIGVGPVQLHDGLVERDVGEFSGLTSEQIEARWPGVLGSGTFPDFFESDASVRERVASSVKEIVAEFEGAEALLIVCHGGLVHAFESEINEPDPTRITNLGGRRFAWSGDTMVAHERINLLEGSDTTSTAPGQL